MQDLTSAYQVQLVAETQLDTIMRQRMGATDAMVQSVKDLCSAQQELGVVGDEVQLSGAQQMATFLNEKASLDTLIPAMNNLIAQLDALRSLALSSQGAGRTEIDLRVRGRDLVKAAANELRSTRRRSGLK